MTAHVPSRAVLELIQETGSSRRLRGPVFLVHPCDGFVSERCLNAAARLAHATTGTVLGVSSWRPEMYDSLPDALAETAERRFGEILEENGAAGSWRATEMSDVEAMQASAHEADVIVTARQQSGSGRTASHVGSLLRTTGRPVYVCPRPAGPSQEIRRAMVCWKDDAYARRATAEALPLLRAATLTRVVMVCSRERQQDARDRALQVERGLLGRGVCARALVLGADRGARLANIISGVAENEDADLVVAGAYGRSPMQRLAGSHTDALLETVQRPLFMSH